MTISAKLTTTLTRSLGPIWCRSPNFLPFTIPLASSHILLDGSHHNARWCLHRSVRAKSAPTFTDRINTLHSVSNDSKSTVYCQAEEKNSHSSKPTEEQLEAIVTRMNRNFPGFFKAPHDFGIYNKNVVFEDNIRNVRTVGLNAYAWQITMIKVGAYLKYAKVSMNLLKLTSHPEDGTIRIRWRVQTFPGNSIIFAFWQFKLWNRKESFSKYEDDWIDGFSIFYVGSDGKVYKHICDKVIPDTDTVKPKKNPKLAVKLGVLFGLLPAGHLC